MLILLSCMAAHALMADMIPSPWLVPDATLVGLVVATSRAPERWFIYGVLAGFFTAIWSARFPAVIFCLYVASGALAWIASRRWQLKDLRIQCALVGLVDTLIIWSGLWLEMRWLPLLLGYALMRAGLSCVALWIVRTACRASYYV